MSTPQDFMEQVVAWPGLEGPGFVNLHWKPTRPVSPHDFRGKPFKELNDLMSFAQYAATRPGLYREIYFCMATQIATGRIIHGNPIAVRSKPGVLNYKCIWIDVDVKDNGYTNPVEAYNAINQFFQAANLPKYSALVASGSGGFHVYWISERPLTKEEWWPYAHGLKAEILRLGLKCDAGLTTDEIRVLRVPGTFNNKGATPNPVTLMYLGRSYDFAAELGHLRAIGGTAPAKVTAAVTGSKIGEFPYDEKLFPKNGMAKAFIGAVDMTDVLGSGIALHADQPLDPRQVFKNCTHYRHALATGGQFDGQGLWMQTVLGATWFENGREFAHALSEKYPKYDPAKTDAMYDRKLTERAANPNLGWPGCTAFASEGAKCKTCPFYNKLRSPLNLADRATVPGMVVHAAPASPPELNLPPSYTVDPETGWICEIITKANKDNTMEEQLLPLFMCKLRNFEAKSGDRLLKFETSLDGQNWGDAWLREATDLITEQTVVKQLRLCGVKPCPKNQGKIVQFMTSFMAKLDAANARAETVTFGWLRNKDKAMPVGFAYGNRVVLETGETQSAGAPDAQIAGKYTPVGDPTLWREAFKIVTDQHHPALEVIIAVSFGSPLMYATGKYNGVWCAWSNLSGAHKSTSVNLGLSVWGCPKTTKETPQSTRKGLIRKLGALKNLPVYWDEINNHEKMDAVRDILGDTTEGANGSRLHQDRTLFETDEWQTMMLVGANVSLTRNIIKNVKDTDAGLQRVFEIEVEKRRDTIIEGDVSRTIDQLNYNYGHAGALYQAVLGKDPTGIYNFVRKIETQFDQEVGSASEFRFRRAMAAATFAGAKLANDHLKTEFNLDEMWAYLKEEFARNSGAITAAETVGGTKEHALTALTQFFKGHVQNALWVTTLPMAGRGKPAAVVHISGPTPTRPAPIHIRLAVNDKVIDVSKQRFSDYLAHVGHEPSTVVSGLMKHFGATMLERMNLSTGTGILGGRETILRIPVLSGGPFVGDLYCQDMSQKPDDMIVTAPVTDPPDPAPTLTLGGASTQAATDLETVRKATE